MPETLLRGIIPPMVTPLAARDRLDAPGLERLIEHILAGGVTALFILGTTGEGPGLSGRLRREMITRTCRLVAGRVPVLVGITDTAFAESVALARDAADAGAHAVVMAPPPYFPLAPAELLDYCDALVAELPLPLFLYNMPSLTKTAFSPETVQRLMEREGIIGIKDSSGDMIYLHRLLRQGRERADWSVLVGPEQLLAEAVLFGANGGVCGGANLHPRLYVALYQAAQAGDRTVLLALQQRVLALTDSVYTLGGQGASVIQGIKCALACLGICADGMTEPFRPFAEPERRRMRALLVERGIAPAEETGPP